MPDEVFVLLVIPIACLCAGMTLHFAVRPFVQAILKAINEPEPVPVDHERLEALAADVHDLSEQVYALRAQAEFDRQLASGAATRSSSVSEEAGA